MIRRATQGPAWVSDLARALVAFVLLSYGACLTGSVLWWALGRALG